MVYSSLLSFHWLTCCGDVASPITCHSAEFGPLNELERDSPIAS